jgi:hypothetical protein
MLVYRKKNVLFTVAKYQSKDVKKKRIKIDPKSVKVWGPDDKNSPDYDDKNYEVAKYSIFKVRFTYLYNIFAILLII